MKSDAYRAFGEVFIQLERINEALDLLGETEMKVSNLSSLFSGCGN